VRERSSVSDRVGRDGAKNGSPPTPSGWDGGPAGETSRPAGNGAAQGAVDDQIPVVYQELRRIARAHLRRERSGHTLNTTALVHEAYVELARFDRVLWSDRAHFLSIAARMMRRVLIDHAVARKALKRNGNAQRVSLHDDIAQTDARTDELVAIGEAIERLERLNPRLARVVECRVFAGMSVDETAGAIGTSAATVKRDWNVARAWLNRELGE
jgi:RNA polymerase sigma factor (TIGR02999 family)